MLGGQWGESYNSQVLICLMELDVTVWMATCLNGEQPPAGLTPGWGRFWLFRCYRMWTYRTGWLMQCVPWMIAGCPGPGCPWPLAFPRLGNACLVCLVHFLIFITEKGQWDRSQLMHQAWKKKKKDQPVEQLEWVKVNLLLIDLRNLSERRQAFYLPWSMSLTVASPSPAALPALTQLLSCACESCRTQHIMVSMGSEMLQCLSVSRQSFQVLCWQ